MLPESVRNEYSSRVDVRAKVMASIVMTPLRGQDRAETGVKCLKSCAADGPQPGIARSSTVAGSIRSLEFIDHPDGQRSLQGRIGSTRGTEPALTPELIRAARVGGLMRLRQRHVAAATASPKDGFAGVNLGSRTSSKGRFRLSTRQRPATAIKPAAVAEPTTLKRLRA
jgi:hypothetical protein